MKRRIQTVREAATVYCNTLRHAYLHWLILTWRPFKRRIHSTWPILVSSRTHCREMAKLEVQLSRIILERDRYKNQLDREQETLTNALNCVVNVTLEIGHRPPNLMRIMVTIPQELFLIAPDVHADYLARRIGYAVERRIMTADLTRLDDDRAAWDRQATRWTYQPYPPDNKDKRTS